MSQPTGSASAFTSDARVAPYCRTPAERRLTAGDAVFQEEIFQRPALPDEAER